MASSAAERVWRGVFGDDPATATADGIPSAAAPDVAHNFLVHLLTRIATALGDALSSPRLVLPWLLGALGSPAGLVGLLVPVREAGALLPQVPIGAWVTGAPRRRGFWIAGSIGQGVAVLGMAGAALRLRGAPAGWAIAALVGAFSLSRGICSVTSKDLVGKTVPRGRRGRLTGWATSIAGGGTLALGAAIALAGPATLPVAAFAGLLGAAGTLWLAAAVSMARLVETPSRVESREGAWLRARQSFRLLGRDASFRRFLLARGLLASTVLAMPFYALLVRDATDPGNLTFVGFLVAANLAAVLGGRIWGRLADRSSRKVMAIAGATAALAGIATFVVTGGSGARPAVVITLYFLLAAAHTGIRIGRQTWLVDWAPPGDRPAYVALANTLIGGILLVTGSLGVLADALSPRGAILAFAALGLVGSVIALGLDEAEGGLQR